MCRIDTDRRQIPVLGRQEHLADSIEMAGDAHKTGEPFCTEHLGRVDQASVPDPIDVVLLAIRRQPDGDTTAVGRVHPAVRPAGPMVLAWAVTSCVALAIVAAVLLMLWSLFDALDAPGGSARAPRGTVSPPLQAPAIPPFGNTTGSWPR
jgi:hypothetical protein